MVTPAATRSLARIRHYLASAEGARIEPARLAVLSTAIAMFARRGFAGTSMRDLGAEVGIRAASLYSRFPDGKDQLLREALSAVFDEFLGFVTEPIDAGDPPARQLRHVLDRHVAWQLLSGDKAPAWDAAINQFGVEGALTAEFEHTLRRRQRLYHGYVEDLFLAVSRRPLPDLEKRWQARGLLAICDASPNLALTARQTPRAVGAAVWRMTSTLAGQDHAEDT